jgi:phosphopantothenoylcysteine decarboxylase/phosphopantothenate--cysteine ligase
MNPRMWSHPATGEAVTRIQQWGARLIAPEEGRTACGDVGEGRLADPDRIVAAIEAACLPVDARRRIVVTSGGTSEPLDAVRVLTNRSTGSTGAGIARRLAEAGHAVTLVRAQSAVGCPGVKEILFETHANLLSALREVLAGSDVDAVVHAAAVSDFAVERIESGDGAIAPGTGKIASGARPVVRLAPLPKIIGALREMSSTPLTVVGFKLTSGASVLDRMRAVETLLAESGADFVVHNDTADIGEDGRFPATIHSQRGGDAIRCASRDDLANSLVALLSTPLKTTAGETAPC